MACDNCECSDCTPSLEEYAQDRTFQEVFGVTPGRISHDRTVYRYFLDEDGKTQWERKRISEFTVSTQSKALDEVGAQLFAYLTGKLTYSWDVAADVVQDVVEFFEEELARGRS